jgi:hypothetical protein
MLFPTKVNFADDPLSDGIPRSKPSLTAHASR